MDLTALKGKVLGQKPTVTVPYNDRVTSLGRVAKIQFGQYALCFCTSPFFDFSARVRYFAPACVTVNVWPPMVIEPVNAVVLVLAATV